MGPFLNRPCVILLTFRTAQPSPGIRQKSTRFCRHSKSGMMSVFGGDLLDFQGTNSFQNSCGGCLDADCKNSTVDKAVNTHVVVV